MLFMRFPQERTECYSVIIYTLSPGKYSATFMTGHFLKFCP